MIVHYVLIFYSDRFGKDKTTLNIKRYDGCFIEGDERLLVDIKDSIVFPYHKIDDMVVEAISLNTLTYAQSC